MGRPGRAALAALAAVLGCRVNVQMVEMGSPDAFAGYDQIAVDEHDRGDVLRLLGPPDRVSYSLGEEILDYRVGRHRGADFRLFIPTELAPSVPFVASVRAVLHRAFAGPEAVEFGKEPAVRAGEAALGAMLGLAPVSGGGPSLLDVSGRRLRWDVARIVLTRNTWIVRRKQILLGVRSEGARDVLGTALLRDPPGPLRSGGETAPPPDTSSDPARLAP